jgi:cytochrome c oxidase subunit 1/cytochrome c oxidase subunit I+III
MIAARQVGSVHDLPQNVFGAGALTWWGMMGMMATEAITLVLVATSYVYIRLGHTQWPPPHTPLPTLTVPVIALVALLLSVPPAWWAARRARAHDPRGVLIGLVLQCALCVVAMVLRYFEFSALRVRWDTNAYGSVAWGVLTAHTLVAVMDVLDTIGLALMFALVQPEQKHFVDVGENSVFWYFVVIAWLPLFVLVFLSPRW